MTGSVENMAKDAGCAIACRVAGREGGEEMRVKKLPKSRPVDRQDFILSACAGKSVLDLGCADYPMTERRYRDGELLFARLHGVAKRVVGVDNSPDGVGILRSLGFEDVILGDAASLKESGFGDDIDVIVAGELLEHIANLDGFFCGVKELMSPRTSLIITVPNSYALKRFLRVMLGSELVNKDHVCSFSQANMEELCSRHGVRIKDTRYHLAEVEGTLKRALLSPLMLFVRYLCPQLCDHLIFECGLE